MRQLAVEVHQAMRGEDHPSRALQHNVLVSMSTKMAWRETESRGLVHVDFGNVASSVDY